MNLELEVEANDKTSKYIHAILFSLTSSGNWCNIGAVQMQQFP